MRYAIHFPLNLFSSSHFSKSLLNLRGLGGPYGPHKFNGDFYKWEDGKRIKERKEPF
jgi:hypothetical protein